MHVLITGNAGFIGSNAIEFLHQKGHKCFGIDCLSDYYSVDQKKENLTEQSKLGIDYLVGDLNDDEVYQKIPQDIDIIIHCAAQPGISDGVSLDTYLKNNVYATDKLVAWASKLPHLKLFINISTSSVYGVYAVCKEDEVLSPNSYYGITKATAEQLVMSAQRKSKLTACSLRLYSVYGPRERTDKLYPKLIEAAFTQKEFPLYQGSINHLRSYTYVKDVCKAFEKCIENAENLNGQIINIGNVEESTTQDAIKLVEDISGKKITLSIKQAREGDQLRTCAITQKAQQLLDYSPKTSLSEGIKQHINWFQKKKLKH